MSPIIASIPISPPTAVLATSLSSAAEPAIAQRLADECADRDRGSESTRTGGEIVRAMKAPGSTSPDAAREMPHAWRAEWESLCD